MIEIFLSQIRRLINAKQRYFLFFRPIYLDEMIRKLIFRITLVTQKYTTYETMLMFNRMGLILHGELCFQYHFIYATLFIKLS